MDLDRYAAVIFDLFGTLVPAYRHHRVLGEMAAELRLDPRRFVAAFAEDTRTARETGRLTLSENLRAICESLGYPANEDRIARAVTVRRRFTTKALSPRDGALETLQRLRDRGLALAIITDCCEVVSEIWDATPLAGRVDASILSCRVGVRKPDPRIYDHACRALGVPADDCLYVGDGGSHELSGAREIGMGAVLLSVPEEADHDPYRPDAHGWDGPIIRSLDELDSP